MKIVVFLGPTLPIQDARSILDAVYLPPVAQGDVARAERDGADVIGIVDGYFECVPAVWHKEILHAMARGVHVLGSSSMGALRAAELAAFGMEGVGSIFEAYHNGELEDDDEVAVIHGPPELGYPSLSEAMVNVRRTLSDAMAAGVIVLSTQRCLESAAKSLHYRDRTWSRVLRSARHLGLAPDQLSALERWLPEGRVDQKREDAVEMLGQIGVRFQRSPRPKEVAYHFENTTIWAAATKSVATKAQAPSQHTS